MGSSQCQRLLNGQGQQIQLLGLLAGHEQVLIERFADLGKYAGKYCGWSRNPAPADRWCISPLFIGVSAIVLVVRISQPSTVSLL